MQSFSNFELWVLENGSDDDTADIVRSIVDPRLRLFELGPIGIQGALQYAIENAPTPWLARMDADDLMRRIPQAFASVRSGEWDRDRFRGHDLCDKRLAILGLGQIGRAHV